MSLNELKNYVDPDDIILKTNQKEILINRETNKNGSMNWKSTDSSIIIKKQAPIFLEDYNKLSSKDIERLNNQIIEIKYNEIEGIEIDELNTVNTVALVTGIVLIISVGIYCMSNFWTFPKSFTLGGNSK
jgi:hypothetical protein